MVKGKYVALLTIPPGVANQVSRRTNTSNWREVNLVRWENGTLSPVGGWTKSSLTGFQSKLRAIHRWQSNAGKVYVAYLCEEHCYVDNGDSLVDITPSDGIGTPSSSGAGGYGDGPYGTSGYGEPRDFVSRLNIATPEYTLDNWGQELRAMTSGDGRLLGWDPVAGGLLKAVTGAPTGNRSFVITPERHIILFGAGGVAQQFVWSDEEDDTDWTPTTTSKAGGFHVEPASPIMAKKLTDFGTLMFTGASAYIIRHIGLPYVYSYEKITDCPPPISPAAIVDTPNGAIWASISGFWRYNGVSAEPLPCTIQDWIDERLDILNTRFQSSFIHVKPKFEVWFLFAGADLDSNQFVAIYNYKDNLWSMGKISRTCGISLPNDPNPIMSDGQFVYIHEHGYSYPGISELPWAETYTMNTARGARLSTIMRMLPEVDGGADAIQFKMVKRNNPTKNEEVMSVPKVIKDNGYVDVRETARDFRLRVEMVKNKWWSMGPLDVEIHMRGDK